MSININLEPVWQSFSKEQRDLCRGMFVLAALSKQWSRYPFTRSWAQAQQAIPCSKPVITRVLEALLRSGWLIQAEPLTRRNHMIPEKRYCLAPDLDFTDVEYYVTTLLLTVRGWMEGGQR